MLYEVITVVQELLPWTIKLLHALRKFKQFSMPMEEFLESQTDSRELSDILTQFFFRKTPTYFALGYFYVWLDYFYPKGGTGVLPNLLKEKILEAGGEIRLNTQIEEVIPSESKVRDSEGNYYEYDYLIWASDLKTLYKELNQKGVITSYSIHYTKLYEYTARACVFIFLAVFPSKPFWLSSLYSVFKSDAQIR